MNTTMQTISFDGKLLQRGFWLYVWKIEVPGGKTLLYVGMTGDTGSVNAQSPFNRVSQHLGHNGKNNALRRHLKGCGVIPEDCRFELLAHGPILSEVGPDGDANEHGARRRRIAAMEAKLADELDVPRGRVMNRVHGNHDPDPTDWKPVRAAFAQHFPELLRQPSMMNG